MKPQSPKPGQVWKDTVNTDLLLVREIDSPSPTLRYARCLVFGTSANLQGIGLIGTQEMQFKHFGTDRFQRLGWLQTVYYRWKMKKWVKEGGM